MTGTEKYIMLKDALKKMERVIIAFSGGVDSTFLLKSAAESGLKDILAVTGVSASVPTEELSCAKEMASSLNVPHLMINTNEINNKDYYTNPPDRCYYCKKELFTKIKDIASSKGYSYILDGTNADDARDWRPGTKAAMEEGISSPLLEVGLSKAEIRELSRSLGLPTWDKPATPCLSSRFPYGEQITIDSLNKVNSAERFIKQFGIRELRVRYHGDLARIEIYPEDFGKLMADETRNRIVSHMKSLGFRRITLDLEGFRSGSSNDVLKLRNVRK